MTQTFQPYVSVIIPIYNGELDLPDLLACLAAQTYPPDRVEYLLVDNASTDRTLDQLQSAITGFEQTIHLRPLSQTQIQSSYAARNTGIKAATGEILAFTDADCRPQPHWLADLVQPFVDPAVAIVAGEILSLPGTTWLEAYADRHQTLSQKHTLAHPFYPYGQTANLAIRRPVLQQTGLFRPYLTTGGDADLCWRIQQQGGQLRFVEQAIVRHRHRSSLRELRQQWQRYGRSNRYLHDLHGVALMPTPTPQDYFYRLSRWLLKELPITVKKILTHSSDRSTLLDTPLALFCLQARTRGQQDAILPNQAAEIDWLIAAPDPPTLNALESVPNRKEI